MTKELDWKAFIEPPTENGYYLTRYLNEDGKTYHKALWWNGKKFIAPRDYIKEVYEYIPDRYSYYVPCMLQDHSKEK